MYFSKTKKINARLIFIVLISSCITASCTTLSQNYQKHLAIQKTATPPQSQYEPMALFLRFAGQTMQGQWVEDDENVVTDISYGKMILNGRAYQATHKIKGSTYGGRTIIFYDESAKSYIYHYFTTAGFHTTGEIVLIENGYKGHEKVNGHPEIAAVSSSVEIEGDSFTVKVQYQSHAGEWSDAPVRTYQPVDGPRPFHK